MKIEFQHSVSRARHKNTLTEKTAHFIFLFKNFLQTRKNFIKGLFNDLEIITEQENNRKVVLRISFFFVHIDQKASNTWIKKHSLQVKLKL